MIFVQTKTKLFAECRLGLCDQKQNLHLLISSKAIKTQPSNVSNSLNFQLQLREIKNAYISRMCCFVTVPCGKISEMRALP